MNGSQKLNLFGGNQRRKELNENFTVSELSLWAKEGFNLTHSPHLAAVLRLVNSSRKQCAILKSKKIIEFFKRLLPMQHHFELDKLLQPKVNSIYEGSRYRRQRALCRAASGLINVQCTVWP